MVFSNIMFDVTNRCNFRCSHCYKEQDIAGTDLPFDYIDNFLNEVEKKSQCSSVILSGGEPLLYPDIKILLKRLNGKYDIRLNTNAFYLDKYIDFLKTINNLRIQISMDGYDDDTFYKIRNCHMFEKILENGLLAKQEGLDVYFRATLTKVSIDNYEKFIELSKRTDISFIIRPIVNTGEERQSALYIEYSRLVEWYKEIEKKQYSEYTGGNSPLTENSCPLLKNRPGISLLTIDNRGNVFPCSLLRGAKFGLGNIKNDSIDSLEESLKKSVLNLKALVYGEDCKRCGFRRKLGDGTCAVSCYFGNKKCIKKKIYEDEVL